MPQFISKNPPVQVSQAVQWIGTNIVDIQGLGAEVEVSAVSNRLRLRAGEQGVLGFVDVPLAGWVQKLSPTHFEYVRSDVMYVLNTKVGI